MILVEIIVLVSWIVIAGVQNAIDNKFDFSDCEPITWHYIKVSWYVHCVVAAQPWLASG